MRQREWKETPYCFSLLDLPSGKFKFPTCNLFAVAAAGQATENLSEGNPL